MKTTLTIVTAFSLALCCSCFSSEPVALVGANPGEWTMDYEAATKLAEEKGMPLLLNFTGSDWCGWCKLMDNNVFADEEWKGFARQNAVLVTIDFPRDPLIVPPAYRERNEKLKNEHAVQGFPTYLILDSDGKTVLGKLGAGKEKTGPSFIEEFQAATRLSETNIAAYISANPEKEKEFRAAINNLEQAKSSLNDWIQTGPEKNEKNIEKFKEMMAAVEQATEALDRFR